MSCSPHQKMGVRESVMVNSLHTHLRRWKQDLDDGGGLLTLYCISLFAYFGYEHIEILHPLVWAYNKALQKLGGININHSFNSWLRSSDVGPCVQIAQLIFTKFPQATLFGWWVSRWLEDLRWSHFLVCLLLICQSRHWGAQNEFYIGP